MIAALVGVVVAIVGERVGGRRELLLVQEDVCAVFDERDVVVMVERDVKEMMGD